MGLSAALVPKIVDAMETKPRIPVLWLHGLECTCCSESFIRSAHPIAQDIVLNLISLDYDDTLQAAAGFQVEEIRRNIMKQYKGQYILAVEGNAPTNDGGVYCTVGGESFLHILEGDRRRCAGDRRLGVLRFKWLRASCQAEPDRGEAHQETHHRQTDHQCSGLPAHRGCNDGRAGPYPDLRNLARTRSAGPPKNVLQPASP